MAAPTGLGNGWQQQLLAMLHAPVTPETLKGVNAWRQAEGGTAAFNPFNTTQNAPGASSYNSVGVRNYPSLQAGLAATVQTLLNGRYAPIVNDLRSGAPAVKLGQDVANSPWGTGGGVLRVLGAGGVQGAPLAGSAARSLASAAPTVAAQTKPALGKLLQQVLSSTDSEFGLPTFDYSTITKALAPAVAKLNLGTTATPATQAAPAAGPLKLSQVPAGFDTRPGIAVDQTILPAVERLASQFGVKVNSGYRSPSHNAAVGGAENSDHLRGDAVDFTGPAAQLAALYRYAQGRFPYVEPMAQAKDHVHISLRR